jgi:uncharacterized protein YgiM (DUF1202 family)
MKKANLWLFILLGFTVLLTIVSTIFNLHNALGEGTVMYVAVSPDSYLKVRYGPGKNYEVIAQLKRGEKVTVEEERGVWVYVKESEGWVSMKYLSTRQLSDEPEQGVIQANGRVNLRNEPDGKLVNYLPVGTEVTIYGYLMGNDCEWVKVDGGYVSAEYVKVEE